MSLHVMARRRVVPLVILLTLLTLMLLLQSVSWLSAKPAMAAPAEAPAFAPTDLFFSEYVEGSSNNKAIELYNGTGGDIDLAASGYVVERYNNGATTPNDSLNLSGVLADGNVYVIAHANAEAAILNVANTTSSITFFNGDDALVLKKGANVIDVIGQVGTDPGSEWGSGDASTANNTIRRKASVCQGDTNQNDAFDPATEWDGFANNTFDGLGSHTVSCAGDNPPSVSSTSPVTGSTDVAVDANIGINFSENVTVTGSWHTMSCTTTGPHIPTVTGGPQNYTLNPDVDFANNESCMVMVVASQVTDQDGTADNMAADYTFTFQTAASANSLLIINEVDADQTSGDTGEFVELYDGGTGNSSLDGMVLVFYNGSDDQSYSNAIDLDGQSTDANGYFVLCGDAANVANCDLDVTPDTNLIQNGADAVALYVGNGTDFPNDTPITTANLLDAIVYDTNDSDDAALLTLLNAGQPQVNEGGGGNKDVHSNQRCPNGTGGQRNTNTYTQALPTPGMPNCVALNMIINELDADQSGTDSAEFIELYDGGTGNTDLSGLVAVLYNGNSDTSYAAFDLDGQSTDSNGYFVLCGNAANVANCDLDVNPDTNLIQNGADAAALYVGNGTDFPNGTPITTTYLLDAIVYDTDDSDDTGLLTLLNAGQPQVDERGGGNGNAHSNQRCPNGAGGQRNTSSYAQFNPTPKAANNCLNADLELSLSVNEANPAEGDTITYTIALTNSASSNITATNVIVRDDLPTITAQIDNVSNSCGAIVAGNTLTWTVGSLPTGTSMSCQISAQVRNGTDGTSFENSAQVLASDQPDEDSTPGNLSGAPSEDDEARVTVQVGIPAVCSNPATKIHTIQGNSATSPEDGNNHTIQGVVVGDYQNTATELSGFYLQEEDADADADATTSEGIFVFDNGFGVDVNVGDVVRVTGQVLEFNSSGITLTELTSISSVVICANNATVTAATVNLPVANVADWEWYEGMLINIPQDLSVSEHFNLGRFGEVMLSQGGRLSQPTNVTTPGAAATALQAENEKRKIILDDANTSQNRDPIMHPSPGLSASNTLRGGDTVSNLTGVLHHSFGVYRIQPTGPISFTASNPRPTTPPAVGGTLKVASFNVLNYFNGDGMGGGFPTPRGADTAIEFTRQRDKIITAVLGIDADIIGLMEIENDGYGPQSAIQDLVNGLNAAAPVSPTYAIIDPGVAQIGTDAIAVGLIYKLSTVTPIGSAVILDLTVDPLFNDDKNRPVLAQTFQQHGTSENVTVAVNHLKSKGSACDDVGDPNTNDGQGNCNQTRTNAATAMANWLATDPTGSGDPDFLIIGDLNAYAMEDPITALKNAGYTNLLGANAYTYVFDGQWGTLDYALSNATLTRQITGAAAWHINADEPRSLDYNEEFQSAGQVISLYNNDHYRASDHDPVLIGLNLSPPPPTYGVELSAIEDNSAFSGSTLSYQVDVKNIGTVADTFHLTVSGNWAATVSPSSVMLAVGETKTVLVNVTIPANATHGSTDTTTVTAVSKGSSSATDTIQLNTTAMLPTTPTVIPPTATPTATPQPTLTPTPIVGGDDGDNDGVDNATENGVPNPNGSGSGDGNGDGIPDSQQHHVSSLPNQGSGNSQGYVTFEVPVGVGLVDVMALPAPAQMPEGVTGMPQGVFEFNLDDLTSQSVMVNLTLHAGDMPDTYYKYDENSQTWYEFLYDGTTGAVISDDGMGHTIITLHFVDGERGDADGTVNGVIDDPGAPAITSMPPTSVELTNLDGQTATNWPFALLATLGLAVGVGLWHRRRK